MLVMPDALNKHFFLEAQGQEMAAVWRSKKNHTRVQTSSPSSLALTMTGES